MIYTATAPGNVTVWRTASWRWGLGWGATTHTSILLSLWCPSGRVWPGIYHLITPSIHHHIRGQTVILISTYYLLVPSILCFPSTPAAAFEFTLSTFLLLCYSLSSRLDFLVLVAVAVWYVALFFNISLHS